MLIGAALDGEITAEEDKELRAHLEGCEACRSFYEAMQAISGTDDVLGDVPEDFTANVMARVHEAAAPAEKPAKKKASIQRLVTRCGALAAAAAVAIWAGVTFSGTFAAKSASSTAREESEIAMYSAAEDSAETETPAEAPAAPAGGRMMAAAPEESAAADGGVTVTVTAENGASDDAVTLPDDGFFAGYLLLDEGETPMPERDSTRRTARRAYTGSGSKRRASSGRKRTEMRRISPPRRRRHGARYCVTRRDKSNEGGFSLSIRGIYSTITDIRRQVFTEVARMGYEGGDYSRIEDLPYKIVPGEVAEHRSSIFLERAIVGERLRLAMGLSPRPLDQHAPLAAGAEESARPEKYYEPPLVNILKFACNACPEKRYIVTNLCQNCLAHPCREICPKKAVKLSHRGVSRIQEDLCIRCGKCADVCPYNAIILQERPCAKACGMDAIRSDEHGRADIDYDKCVSCGMCLVNCPFGAISDKSQLFQLTQALRGGEKVIAIVAPAFVGQLGPSMTPDKLKAAMKMLGFRHVAEVAVGADLCTLDEAKDFLEKVPAEQPFMATSCCPSWAVMAKKLFPEQANCISMALTPMVLTARLCKQQHPGEKVAFIGPCSAKKLEAMRTTVRSEVDFVLTFEEVMGMFEAKGINFNEITQTAPLREGTAAGRGFAVSGGVAEAVREAISHIDPDREVKTACAQGLKDCRKMLTLAKAGKYDGYLLEGMACPGGCVAGAGTLLPIEKAAAIVRNYTAQAEEKSATETKYEATLPLLLEDDEDAE